MDKFDVEIALCIYLYDQDEASKQVVISCAVLKEDDDYTLSLPRIRLSHSRFSSVEAVQLVRNNIFVDPRELDIVPLGFFDPFDSTSGPKENRVLLAAYRTHIHPGTPVNPSLEFLKYEEAYLARKRFRIAHFQAYRAGFGQ